MCRRSTACPAGIQGNNELLAMALGCVPRAGASAQRNQFLFVWQFDTTRIDARLKARSTPAQNLKSCTRDATCGLRAGWATNMAEAITEYGVASVRHPADRHGGDKPRSGLAVGSWETACPRCRNRLNHDPRCHVWSRITTRLILSACYHVSVRA
jgi:hypothetical protein